MKKLSLIFLLFTAALTTSAQNKQIDTLRVALSKAAGPDTIRMNILHELTRNYFVSKPDSALIFAHEYYDIAVKLKRVKDQASALNAIANSYSTLGDYVKAFSIYFKTIKLYENINDIPGMANEYSNIGSGYTSQQDYIKALPYLRLGLKKWLPYAQTHKLTGHTQKIQTAILLLNIGEVFLYTHQIDSADYYLQNSYVLSKKNNLLDLLGNIERDLGEVEAARGHKAAAFNYFRQSLPASVGQEDGEMLSITYLSMANLYHHDKQQDSAEYYAQKALEAASAQGYLQDVFNAGKVLYAYYEEDHNLPQAYKYLKITTATKDNLFSQDKVKQLLSLDFDEKQRQADIEAAHTEAQNRLRTYILSGGLVVLLLLALISWRNSRQRQRANSLLKSQNAEIEKQKKSVETTLGELKTTQNQLVQSAKMASLGEMTAGIAHEIQNPLNFVNNFSEVNKDLLEELKAESTKPKAERNEQLELELINDLINNELKINHHGKRADFIVKGMLEHSRTNTSERQATNINVLADEFLKLSYHGLRAKNKHFNADLVTHFDTSIPRMNIVQQDIGRVLINLFGNAFYAVNQKAKTAGKDYKPTVEVNTVQQNGSVLVSVKDNGTGIPDNIREKIMQPFFTTKPTGEGTGLGLSLSYDIVTKGHGGTIQVNSKEGEGSEFVIQLPLS